MSLDQTLAALADPTRRRVIDLHRERPRRAGELARATKVSPPLMSRHLRKLRIHGLVEEQHADLSDLLLCFHQAVRIEMYRAITIPIPWSALPPDVNFLSEDPEGAVGIGTNDRGHGNTVIRDHGGYTFFLPATWARNAPS